MKINNNSVRTPSIPACQKCGQRRVLPARVYTWGNSSTLKLSKEGLSCTSSWAERHFPVPACPHCGAPAARRPATRGLKQFTIQCVGTN